MENLMSDQEYIIVWPWAGSEDISFLRVVHFYF